MTQNPYMIKWKNGSMIIGFTTGASSGSGGASIRGQRADYIYMDECDYMGTDDFDTVAMIGAERSDIGMFISSTPTGKRGKFYDCCMNPKMGFKQHYHPSMHNPNWCDQMEAEFREQLSEQSYVHEVLAEFGTQETGVFNKDKIDAASNVLAYAYEPLTYIQNKRMQDAGIEVEMLLYEKRAPVNPFRCVGVDWDKYGASSSILVLDFDIHIKKFKVIKRIEVPRAEYSYDAAVNLIVEVNEKFNPSWIYCDRGSGEYQIERLHIIGDERPHTGLKNKVRGFQFKENIEVIDPITKQKTNEPMKPFMVNQLVIAFERDKMMLSPFDEVLHKQLIDYEVERISQAGLPVFTSKDEHFIDALGLAMLAFVQNFPGLTNTVKKPEYSNVIKSTVKSVTKTLTNAIMAQTESFGTRVKIEGNHGGDLRGDRPTWVKVPLGSTSPRSSSMGSRGRGSSGGRKSW